MTRANLQLTDYDAVGRPNAEDLEKVAAPLSALLTQELDGAADMLALTSDEILVAALGRAIERTIGGGTVAIDVPGYGTSLHPMVLTCAPPEQVNADEMLSGVHRTLEALSDRHVVHGVPDDPRAQDVSEVLFANGATAGTRAHLGHVLELRAYRDGDVIALEWWFDTRSFEPYTVQELAEQFPLALIELTSEATPTSRATTELAMAH
jgi:hypothetical protein